MESPGHNIEILSEKLETYSKTSFELYKLKILQTITIVATSLISRLSVFILLSLFIVVLNIGIAIWLGDIVGKVYWGFFIVAAFYLIAGIIVHFFLQNWIKQPITNIIIKEALQ